MPDKTKTHPGGPAKPEYGNFGSWKMDKTGAIKGPGNISLAPKMPHYDQAYSMMTKDYEVAMSDYDTKRAAYDKDMSIASTARPATTIKTKHDPSKMTLRTVSESDESIAKKKIEDPD